MASSSRNCNRKVALVAGITGIVGTSLAEQLTAPASSRDGGWKVYGIARRERPVWFAEYKVEYLRCDLLNREETLQKLALLTDVTHFFYATWISQESEQANCEANGNMLKNALDALLPNAKELQHVCLQTGIKHYLGSHFSYDGVSHPSIYHEDLPRLPETNFYYVQEDILFDAVSKSKGRTTWSVHRPGLIFGTSPYSLVNIALALAVYASICKHEGLPFAFTGTQRTWESHLEASDADLVAEQEIWAATSEAGNNQAFNVSNGDSVSWKEIWPVIAWCLGVAASPHDGQPRSLVEMMRSKVEVWEAIVREQGLFPTKLEDLMNGLWVVDIVLLRLPSGRSSMEKCVRHGFLRSRDTKACLIHLFEKMRMKKLIPS